MFFIKIMATFFELNAKHIVGKENQIVQLMSFSTSSHAKILWWGPQMVMAYFLLVVEKTNDCLTQYYD